MSLQAEDLVVPGFMANGIHCGIKEEDKRDLALIFSVKPATAAGVFTTNTFKAAPVLLDMKRLKKGIAQAILANSGNANAGTGAKGYDDAVAVTKAAARALGIREDLVLAASTGIIGSRLPLPKIRKGVGRLVKGLRPDGIPAAEEGIMTTDKFPKIEYRKISIQGKEIRLCGIAKGAGMIEPNMATMLCFIMTDAAIERETLATILKKGVRRSFNAITVDGCMSTNDTVILLANGISGNRVLRGRSAGLSIFEESLSALMGKLALDMVKDGEGATKVISITVSGARTVSDAKTVAMAIARSNLVKTAFFGRDANWGRIIAAMGSTGIPREDRVELLLGGVPLFRDGSGLTRDESKLAPIMEQDQIEVLVRLGQGGKSFSVYASDLSYEYVQINAHYHT